MTDYKLNNDGGMSVIESQQTKRFHKTCFSKQTKHIVAAATLPMMMLSPLTNSYAEEPELDFGGFIKISAAATTDGVAGFDDAAGFYNADLLFADSDQGTRFGLDARETRLHLTYRHSDTPIGPVKVYIESNFGGEGSTNGNANETYGNHQLSLVLRHAYIETNGFLIGQTFSTFSDLSIVTNILDYGGNAGMIFSRNPQIRYTHQVGDFTLKMALENASSTFDYNNVTDDQRLPDFVGRKSVV